MTLSRPIEKFLFEISVRDNSSLKEAASFHRFSRPSKTIFRANFLAMSFRNFKILRISSVEYAEYLPHPVRLDRLGGQGNCYRLFPKLPLYGFIAQYLFSSPFLIKAR